MSDQPPRKGVTRHLSMEDMPSEPPRISTRPLDYIMPWVIELRVVGTPAVIPVRVREVMAVGRIDAEQPESRPDIDLEPYGAYMAGVSRRHAQFIARENRVYLEDLGSANGTFLNNGRLEKGQQYPLHHGDRVKLSRLELQILFVIMPTSQQGEVEAEKQPASAEADAKVPKIGSGQQVWVVDDDQHVAQTVRDVLTEVGYQVTIINNVTDALFRLVEETPAAIVLELMLQEGSGLDLIRHVRSRDDLKTLPLVVITISSGGYQMGQAIDAGVDVFLKKPVGLDELLYSFSRILPAQRS